MTTAERIEDNSRVTEVRDGAAGEILAEGRIAEAAFYNDLGVVVDVFIQSSPDAIQGGRYVGKNFYLSNGIPVTLLLLLLKNSMEQANANFETQVSTALSTGGFLEGEGGGISKQREALAALIAEAQRDSGMQQAIQSILDGAKQLSGGLVTVISGPIMAKYSGDSKAEEANVAKLTNAIDTAKDVPAGGVSAGDRELTPAEEGMQSAIGQLEGGTFKITAKDNHYGSVEVGEGDDAVYRVPKAPADLKPGEPNDPCDPRVNDHATVSEAIAAATPKQKRKILKQFESDRKTAQNELNTKRHHVENKRQTIERMFNSFSQMIAGGVDITKNLYIIEKAENDAKETMIRDIQQGLKTVGDRQHEQTSKVVQTEGQLIEELRNAIRTAQGRA